MEMGFYNYDLITQLGTQVDSYEQDRRKYWENQESEAPGWSAMKFDRAERFAKGVLKNAEQLIPVHEIKDDMLDLNYEMSRLPDLDRVILGILISDLPKDEKHDAILKFLQNAPEAPSSESSPLRLVWERFVIDLSWDAVEKIEEGASRIFRLYELVLRSAPSEPTQKFLSRLSRCFVWGFDPECVILCRAVIDTSFRDAVSDEICEKHCGKNDRHVFTLSNRIQAARKEGMIDEDTKIKAFKVKDRGNEAVHNQPDFTKDVWDTVCRTVDVLEALGKQSS